ncbi:MAG: Hsp20/alpha crystallin family protein [Deltaproteobacteria bacterium]|jgi:HSP20 family molecular chaperone IbpA|nr:Hsp20/alpha crystallin family protein [Deltaproteobacteria bacterium]MBW2543059.1 Hsp20/alpha crystallin family protein [Deltaproteobacteria bacterium]
MSSEVTRAPELQVREKQQIAEEGTRPGAVFRPDVDILEHGDEYLIYADLPGVDEQRVRINLDKRVLSLDAELAADVDPAWSALHTEYHLGGFHREFRLSDEIDAARVSASMRDGVLELRLPKNEAHQSRKIEVRAA